MQKGQIWKVFDLVNVHEFFPKLEFHKDARRHDTMNKRHDAIIIEGHYLNRKAAPFI